MSDKQKNENKKPRPMSDTPQSVRIVNTRTPVSTPNNITKNDIKNQLHGQTPKPPSK